MCFSENKKQYKKILIENLEINFINIPPSRITFDENNKAVYSLISKNETEKSANENKKPEDNKKLTDRIFIYPTRLFVGNLKI